MKHYQVWEMAALGAVLYLVVCAFLVRMLAVYSRKDRDWNGGSQ